MALFWRIWVAVIAINLVVLFIFAILAIVQYANINAGLAADRLKVLATRTAAPFEAASKIGLPLSTVRNAKALLERSKQSDDAILAIDVFDTDGLVIHSTSDLPNRNISNAAQTTRREAQGKTWHHETSDSFLSGIEILTRDKNSAGGIMITYSNVETITRVRAVGAELGLGAFVVFLVTSVLSAGLLGLGLRQQIGFFNTIEETISNFEHDTWRSSSNLLTPGARSGENELMDLLVNAERNYQLAKQELGESRKQVE